jgi:hypothetical protein
MSHERNEGGIAVTHEMHHQSHPMKVLTPAMVAIIMEEDLGMRRNHLVLLNMRIIRVVIIVMNHQLSIIQHQ